MKVSLNLQERIALFDFIALNYQQASPFMWKLIRQANEILGLEEKDHEKYGIKKTPQGGTFAEKVEEAEQKEEYTLPDRLVINVKEDLQKIAAKGKLTKTQFFIFEALGVEEIEPAEEGEGKKE